MNYYPNNYYQNYPYGNSYQQQSQQIIPALQGKVVDSPDMVRVSEVPFGGFGVFPKGDLSEIYVKSWNNNGTTQINTYKPVPIEENKESQEQISTNELLEKINALSEKVDVLIKGFAKPQITNNMSNSEKVKDVNVNAY